jgi:5-methylcytosine-specific restriction endonuclease McrA
MFCPTCHRTFMMPFSTFVRGYLYCSRKCSGLARRRGSCRGIRGNTNEWFTIRSQIFKRDHYQCVLCNSKEKLHCHHIIPWRFFANNESINLITLCKSCHLKLEGKLREKRNQSHKF